MTKGYQKVSFIKKTLSKLLINFELSKNCEYERSQSKKHSRGGRESKQEEDGNSLKPRRESGGRRTSLADLIPDWPVLTKKKRAVKVIYKT